MGQTKKETKFDQNKNRKRIQQQLGGREVQREPACISGLLSCWHITANTVTFASVPPPKLKVLDHKLLFTGTELELKVSRFAYMYKYDYTIK